MAAATAAAANTNKGRQMQMGECEGGWANTNQGGQVNVNESGQMRVGEREQVNRSG